VSEMEPLPNECNPRCGACPSVPSARLDHVGAAASCLCAAHCAGEATLTLATASFPVAGTLFGSAQVETALAVASAAIALGSVVRGYGRHRDRGVIVLMAVGLSLLGAAHWISAAPPLELTISVLGSVCLVAGHAGNAYRARRASLTRNLPLGAGGLEKRLAEGMETS
jgi:hypothetical protein